MARSVHDQREWDSCPEEENWCPTGVIWCAPKHQPSLPRPQPRWFGVWCSIGGLVFNWCDSWPQEVDSRREGASWPSGGVDDSRRGEVVEVMWTLVVIGFR
jgi:hypothetical protein